MIVERRLRERFPLQLGVAYRHPDSPEWTTTTTLNISSSGLLFTTPEEIWRPDPIEIFLDWPGLLDHRVPIKLVIAGHVVRSSRSQAAVTIERYEFKTRRTAPAVNREEEPLLAAQ